MKRNGISHSDSIIEWLKDVRNNSRLWFWVVIAFIIAQLFFTIIGIEVSPFRNYGMYSRPEKAAQRVTAYEIVANGQVYDFEKLSDLRTELLLSPLESYLRLYRNNMVDPNAAIFDKKFGWLPRWITAKMRPRIVQDQEQALRFERGYAGIFYFVTGIETYGDVVVNLIQYSFDGSEPLPVDSTTLLDGRNL